MSAGIWAIVPVKAFGRAKSRLASVLPAAARASLSRGFFERTLGVLASVPEIAEIVVVSRDPLALALARDADAQALVEGGRPDLNRALEQATRAALDDGATAVLIVPTDLPFLTAEDVRALIAAHDAGPAVTLAPDRHEAGTNALLVQPPGLFAYAFGEGSFTEHRARAQAAGAAVQVLRRAGLALDVDRPEDLAVYQAAQPAAK